MRRLEWVGGDGKDGFNEYHGRYDWFGGNGSYGNVNNESCIQQCGNVKLCRYTGKCFEKDFQTRLTLAGGTKKRTLRGMKQIDIDISSSKRSSIIN